MSGGPVSAGRSRPLALALLLLLACPLPGRARGREASWGDDPSPREFVVSVPPPAPLGEVPDAADLLRLPAVVADLGLAGSQRSRLDRALLGRARRRDLARPPADASDRAEAEQESDQLASAIARTLNAAQLGRLAEIGVRRDGILGLARADVAEALGLDDDQRDRLAPILEGAFDDLVEAAEIRLTLLSPASRPGAPAVLDGDDLDEFRRRLALARSARARILEDAAREAGLVLDRRQRAGLARLIGRPFDASIFRPDPPVDAVATSPVGR